MHACYAAVDGRSDTLSDVTATPTGLPPVEPGVLDTSLAGSFGVHVTCREPVEVKGKWLTEMFWVDPVGVATVPAAAAASSTVYATGLASGAYARTSALSPAPAATLLERHAAIAGLVEPRGQLLSSGASTRNVQGSRRARELFSPEASVRQLLSPTRRLARHAVSLNDVPGLNATPDTDSIAASRILPSHASEPPGPSGPGRFPPPFHATVIVIQRAPVAAAAAATTSAHPAGTSTPFALTRRASSIEQKAEQQAIGGRQYSEASQAVQHSSSVRRLVAWVSTEIVQILRADAPPEALASESQSPHADSGYGTSRDAESEQSFRNDGVSATKFNAWIFWI